MKPKIITRRQLPLWSRMLVTGCSLLVSLLAVTPTQAETPQPAQPGPGIRSQDLLKDTYTTAVTNCQGWGKWDAPPCITANSGTAPAQLLNGAITIPARSVVIHPGTDRDVAVVWQSPIAGKIKVQAKVTHVHPSGGDGITWAIVHTSPTGRKLLCSGAIERGGSQTIPSADDAAKLATVTVQQGDGLSLLIGPGETYACDSTLVAFTITEVVAAGRTWDLAQDVSANIHAGNPHADSFGNAAVWHFVAPVKAQGAVRTDSSLTGPREIAGQRIESWTIATDDTKLTVGATRDGQLCLYELNNPLDDWNWTKEPSVFNLLRQSAGGKEVQNIRWQFKDGKVDQGDGQRVTLRFVSENPSLELQSVWSAQPGRGPIHHVVRIVNRAEKPVTLFSQPSLFLDLAGRETDGPLTIWTFHTDGATPDKRGVYQDSLGESASRQIDSNPEKGLFIPYAVFDGGGKHGVYIGIEWSVCRITAAVPPGQKAGSVRVRGGESEGFKITVGPGETFEAPPAFVGTYAGDLDDAGNSLRRHLFQHNVPEIVKKDATYPKIQWNAFEATGDKPHSWNCVEKKFYPLIDDIAPLGFEEVMIDVGWWKQGGDPVADPVDWPSGMAKAADYAHKAGLRFGLYWNRGEEMAKPESRNRRMAHIKQLYNEHHADMWRSDSTGGIVIGHDYSAVRGFYAMCDQLSQEMSNFQWENCICGGRAKDFGAMKRTVKVFNTDTYAPEHVRQAFYDASYALPPAQLMGCLGYYRPKGPAGMKFGFRTTSLGAPEWFIDAPNGGNGGGPWTVEEKAAVKSAVATYKAKIRSLVRNADLYHILPRPDGKRWDGIQYYDPTAGKGVSYLFKQSAGTDTMPILFRGVDPKRTYKVTFEDGSNPAVEKTGEELLKGIHVTLKGAPVSELVFLETK